MTITASTLFHKERERERLLPAARGEDVGKGRGRWLGCGDARLHEREQGRGEDERDAGEWKNEKKKKLTWHLTNVSC